MDEEENEQGEEGDRNDMLDRKQDGSGNISFDEHILAKTMVLIEDESFKYSSTEIKDLNENICV